MTDDYSHLFPNIAEREEAVRLRDAVATAKLACANHDVHCVIDPNGDPVRCEKSGIPIIQGDEWVEDLETGEVFLRAVVGLPPRAILTDEEYETEDESEFEPENA